MKTPREKYQNDTQYKMLVDSLVSTIHECQFTPSEIREASMLACIIYEEDRIYPLPTSVPPESVVMGLETINKWVNKQGV